MNAIRGPVLGGRSAAEPNEIQFAIPQIGTSIHAFRLTSGEIFLDRGKSVDVVGADQRGRERRIAIGIGLNQPAMIVERLA